MKVQLFPIHMGTNAIERRSNRPCLQQSHPSSPVRRVLSLTAELVVLDEMGCHAPSQHNFGSELRPSLS